MTRREYKNMPDQGRTGLYRLMDAHGRLLYIGISCNPAKRYDSHRWHKPHRWRHEIACYTTEWFGTREEAERAEIAAIRSELPLHNRVRHPNCDAEPWSGYPAPDAAA